MPSLTLHTSSSSSQTNDTNPSTSSNKSNTPSPLPALMQTPNGLAILEIQGTLNTPSSDTHDDATDQQQPSAPIIARLHFPDLDANPKKVILYVGATQRLVGEVKQLAKPLAVVGRRQQQQQQQQTVEASGERVTGEELEIVDIVRYKLFFGGRPEFV